MGSIILTPGSHFNINMWNMENGKLIKNIKTGHKAAIWNCGMLDVIFYDFYPVYDFATNDNTPTSNIVITASPDKTAKQWDRRLNKCVSVMNTGSPNFQCNIFNDYNVHIGRYSLLSLFDLRKPNELVDSI